MNIEKKFFKNTDDFVQFILTTDLFKKRGIEAVEEFLGIEFEMGDTGVFPSDLGKILDERFYAAEGLDVNLTSWRVTDGWNLPTYHPFVFVYIIETASERFFPPQGLTWDTTKRVPCPVPPSLRVLLDTRNGIVENENYAVKSHQLPARMLAALGEKAPSHLSTERSHLRKLSSGCSRWMRLRK